jgi:TATA-box binding protein (TBP) (component of TFIID and TFIIIB)
MAVVKVVDELKNGGIVILAKPEIQIQNIASSAGLRKYIQPSQNCRKHSKRRD